MGSLRIAFVLVGVLVVAACSGQEPPPSGKPVPRDGNGVVLGEFIHDAPPVDPLKLAQTPLWSGRPPGRAREIPELEPHGDALVGVGTGDQDDWGVTVLDAAKGTVRWSYGMIQPVRGGDGAVWSPSSGYFVSQLGIPQQRVVGSGDDWTVLGGYYCEPSQCRTRLGDLRPHGEHGLVALSGKDGTVRWLDSFAQYDSDEDAVANVVGASADTALVAVETVGNTGEPVTVAVDLATGKVRWQQHRMIPLAVVGDTAIGLLFSEPGQVDLSAQHQLTAFDLHTGEGKWEIDDPVSRLQLVAGGLAVVRGASADGNRPDVLVLDVSRGRILAHLGATANTCASDQETVLACTVTLDSGDEAVVSFRLDGTPLGVAKLPADLSDPELEAVWQDRLLVHDGGRNLVLDLAGHKVNELPGPGTVDLVTPERAVYRLEDGFAAYAVRSS